MTEVEVVQKKRGRPRSQATMDRDEAVYNYLKQAKAEGIDAVSRTALAEALDLDGTSAYLALTRLRKTGAVRRTDRKNTWAVSEEDFEEED